MIPYKGRCSRRWRNQEGAVTSEYALVASLIAIAIIGTLYLMRAEVVSLYETIEGRVVDATDD